MRWIALVLAVISASCFAGIPDYKFDKKEIGSHINLSANSVAKLSIPLSILESANIVGVDGLVVVFKDRSAFSIDTLSSKDIGYPESDMRLWPKFMLGEEPVGDYPPNYVEDVKKSRQVLVESNKPYKTGQFKTENGKCFLLMGKEKTSIYITDNSNKEIITLITTTGMTEEKIQEYILQGVL